MVRTSPSITGATISAPSADPRSRHHGRGGAEQEDEPAAQPRRGAGGAAAAARAIELGVATARP